MITHKNNRLSGGVFVPQISHQSPRPTFANTGFSASIQASFGSKRANNRLVSLRPNSDTIGPPMWKIHGVIERLCETYVIINHATEFHR
jgi:hypothetical protein